VFVQSSTAALVASGVSTQIASFTQSADVSLIASGIAEMSFNFTQSSAAINIASGVVIQDFNFTQSVTPSVVFTTSVDIESLFTQSVLGGLLEFGVAEMSASFIMTADGRILWEQIIPTGTENWTTISHTGDTWTPINASGTIEQWTEKVV
jgi:hypothetical protein